MFTPVFHPISLFHLSYVAGMQSKVFFALNYFFLGGRPWSALNALKKFFGAVDVDCWALDAWEGWKVRDMFLLVGHSHRWWHYPGKRILPDREVRAYTTYSRRKIALLQVQFTHLFSLKLHIEFDTLDRLWGNCVLQIYLLLWLINWWAVALGIIPSLRTNNTTSGSWKVFWPTSL